MFILARLYRQARISNYSNREIAKFCVNDSKFASFTYHKKSDQFNTLTPGQKAAIIQAHLHNQSFFVNIGFNVLTQYDKKNNKYSAFSSFEENFKNPDIKKPWYKRWLPFSRMTNQAASNTPTALDYIFHAAEQQGIPFRFLFTPSEHHQDAAARMNFLLGHRINFKKHFIDLLKLAARDSGAEKLLWDNARFQKFNEQHWNSNIARARKHPEFAALFLGSRHIQAHFKGKQDQLFSPMNLSLWDQYANLDQRYQNNELTQHIIKQLHAILDRCSAFDALELHQHACWNFIKDEPFMTNHQNNPSNAVIYQEIDALMKPNKRQFGGRSSTFTDPATRVQLLVDKAKEDKNVADILLNKKEDFKRQMLSPLQIVSIIGAHAKDTAFLENCLQGIDLSSLIEEKETADALIENSALASHLSLEQLQGLEHDFYSERLDQNHFKTLGFERDDLKTAETVKAKRTVLIKRHHSDKTRLADDSLAKDINRAFKELYLPLLNKERISALIQQKEEAQPKDELLEDLLELTGPSRTNRASSNLSGFRLFRSRPSSNASATTPANTAMPS